MPMLIVVVLAFLLLALLAAAHPHGAAAAHDRIGQGLRRGRQGSPPADREKNEIGLLARAFARMRDEVRTRANQEADNRAREILVAAKAAAERDAQEARALAALLRHSLQPTSMKTTCRRPWIPCGP